MPDALAALGGGYRERLLQLARAFVAIPPTTVVAIPTNTNLRTPSLAPFLCEWRVYLCSSKISLRPMSCSSAVIDDPLQDFSTFSFDSADTAPAISYQPCAPLDQQYEIYAPQDSQESFISYGDPRSLTINTSFAGSWTTSSSPLSSIPGTPQMSTAVHRPCDPTTVIDTCFHPLNEVYDPSADYLPQPQDPGHHHQLYSAGVPVSVPVPVPVSAYCAPHGHGHPHGIDSSSIDMDLAYGAAHAQDFGGVPPKDGFSPFYGRQALDAAVYAPASYMAPVPSFM